MNDYDREVSDREVSDREVSDALDALNEAGTPQVRAHRLTAVATLLHTAARKGGVDARGDEDLATLLNLLADVELVAAGHAPCRRATGTRFEGVAGHVLDAMCTERDITGRAGLLEALADAVDGMVGDDVRESLACLPYRPGHCGWISEPYLPRPFPKMVTALWRSWRDRRAA